MEVHPLPSNVDFDAHLGDEEPLVPEGRDVHQQLEVNVDGSISAPTRPGLGFDLNRTALEKFKIEG
ncbi:hypothetical protein PY650_24225 [Rhizobium calliandrae]|uniref:Enolase C-terminal domain-containing protein n=1 Tax=Rhizobium calliandrae TaxID=1312182 RepID=A0ABT7KL56_9HYPH|nr:hypothetical protein [Rhizobium calliandrae]MDL2408693.1 hypothetical protein [Rhizobium calliandrae]